MKERSRVAAVILVAVSVWVLAVPAAAGPALTSTALTSTARTSTVVQLGDSYSAGYGVLDGDERADRGGCLEPGRFRPEITPGGRLADRVGAELIFAACGGAEIPDVLAQFRSVQPDLPPNGAGAVIVFTAGGNDLRSDRGEMWTEIITRCILWDRSCEQRSRNQPDNLSDIGAAMNALVDEIAAAAPEATVRVLGYPELMQRTPGCWGMTGIDRNEADFLDRIARDLNDTLESAVRSVATARGSDIVFVNPEDAFDDHGACQVSWSNQRYVNDVDFVPWSIAVAANSLHPTAKGYDAYARLLDASLGAGQSRL